VVFVPVDAQGGSGIPNWRGRPEQGLFLFEGDSRRAGRILDDMHSPDWGFRSRTVNNLGGPNIALTNMTWPVWHWDGKGVAEFKTVSRLDKKREWIPVFDFFLGSENFRKICQPGIGMMDTNEPDTNPYDPAYELKLQSLDWGNNIREILPSHAGVPDRYVRVKTMDYNNPPTRDADGRWMLNGKPVGLRETPELFIVQSLVGHSGSGSAAVSYGPVADKGYPGGRGKIVFPFLMNYPAYHMRHNVHVYSKPRFRARVFDKSLVVEGVHRHLTGGIEIEIDALCFTGFDVYGREAAPGIAGTIRNLPVVRNMVVTGEKWYLLETMQMRGDIYDRSAGGTWRDWLLFCDYGGNAPPVCGVQDIGWRRTKAGAEWFLT